MHEIYVILGRVGWTWLGVWLVLVAVGMIVQHVRRRRRLLQQQPQQQQRNGVREFEVTVSNEKQS